MHSSRVELLVSNIDTDFSAKLEANVLNNITSDTPTVQWSELKNKWPHLSSIPFQRVAKRQQIDVLIGSDHPLFHRVLQEICGNKPYDPVARLTTGVGLFVVVFLFKHISHCLPQKHLGLLKGAHNNTNLSCFFFFF